jgi:hypothetical protein
MLLSPFADGENEVKKELENLNSEFIGNRV